MVTNGTASVHSNRYAEKANALYEERKIGYLLSSLKKDGRKSFFLKKIQQLEQFRNDGERERFDLLFEEIENEVSEIKTQRTNSVQSFFGGNVSPEQTLIFKGKAYLTTAAPTLFQLDPSGDLERKSFRERLSEPPEKRGYFHYLSGLGPVGIVEKINGKILSRSCDWQFEGLKGHWIVAYV